MSINSVDKIFPPKGGISKIELFAAADLDSIHYDRVSGKFKALRLKDGKSPAEYRLREGEASYEEKLRYEHGETIVTHTLSMGLHVAAEDMERVVKELSEASPEGIIAIVHTNGAGKLLAGYSERFGKEFALELASAETATGTSLSQPVRNAVVLQSEDTCKACIITT